MENGNGRHTFDRTFSVDPAKPQTLAFDVPADLYRATLTAPAVNCSESDYWPFIAGGTRTFDVAMDTGSDESDHPMVMLGSAPADFVALHPTFVMLDKGVSCGQPILNELPMKVQTEDDGTNFFAWLYPNAELEKHRGSVLALKVLVKGQPKYVPLRVAFPAEWSGFPAFYNVEISDDAVTLLERQGSDMPVCEKVMETKGTILLAPTPSPRK